MLVPFTGQSFDDDAYGLPSARLINWYAEAAPERPNRSLRLLPVPGVVSFASALTTNAVTGFEVDDQTGRIIAHSGSTVAFYDPDGTLVAQQETAFSDQVTRFAKSQLEIVMSTGSSAFVVSQTGATAVTLPSGASGAILDVAESGQRHLYIESGSGRLWWSDVADAATIQADAFLTAEDDSDNLRAIRVFQGSVYLFGARSIQVLRPSGNIDAPFYPSPGGTIPKGVVGRGAVTTADFGQFFVGDDGLVYRLSGYQAQRISTNWIERRIQSVTDRDGIILTSYAWEGHTFLVMRLPGVGTWVWDAASQMWHRLQSYGVEESNRTAFFELDGKVYVGMSDGQIGTLSGTTTKELGQITISLAGSIVPIEDGRPVIRNAVVEAQAGLSPNTDPLEIEMRMSSDGRRWRAWLRGSVGRIGEYAKRTVFGPFGAFSPPLMAVEIRYSGATPLAINGVKFNQGRP